jgi:outer membrane murein-binding lipoprotein Lpp
VGYLKRTASAWYIDGTAVTATAAEINAIAGGGLSAAELGVLDGVTPGTVTADKAVVAGTAGAVSGLGDTTWADGKNLIFNATTGTKIGATGDKLGFYGATPIVKPATAYTQTYSTADKTHANSTFVALATTAATQSSPWGFATQAQADAIATKVNTLGDDVTDLKQLVNAIIDDLQALGLVG